MRSAWRRRATAAVRERLARLDPAALAEVLSASELEALNLGARERITDMQHPQIAALPLAHPGLFAVSAARARQAGFDGV